MQQEGTEPVCYYNFRPNYEKIDRIKYLKMSASRTHKGVDPEIKKVLNLDKMTPKTKNAQGQTIACDFMEKIIGNIFNMSKQLILFLLFAMMHYMTVAQNYRVAGTVSDKPTEKD